MLSARCCTIVVAHALLPFSTSQKWFVAAVSCASFSEFASSWLREWSWKSSCHSACFHLSLPCAKKKQLHSFFAFCVLCSWIPGMYCLGGDKKAGRCSHTSHQLRSRCLGTRRVPRTSSATSVVAVFSSCPTGAALTHIGWRW